MLRKRLRNTRIGSRDSDFQGRERSMLCARAMVADRLLG
jgi:hypothetical protein